MNRNTLVNNGTVFGAWGLGRSIAIVGALLVITFVVIEPDASQGLSVAARVVFWTIHVGLALAALYAASWLVLPRIMNSLPAWLALLVAGTGGALLLAPAAVDGEHVDGRGRVGDVRHRRGRGDDDDLGCRGARRRESQ